MHPRRAIFLDRDGVIVRDTGYIRSASELDILPGAPEALARLRGAGFLLIVVSNQSGVARGLMTLHDMLSVQRALDDMLAAHGAAPDAAYFCPHHPSEGVPPFRMECNCRKPRPGLILRAAGEWAVDLRGSWLVGDADRDIAAAHFAGVRPLRVGSPSPPFRDVPAFGSLIEAAGHILAEAAP